MTQILKPTDTPQRACSPDEPVMVAWKAYQATDDYKNTRNWALHEKSVDGSLWATFSHGFFTRHSDPDELREALEATERVVLEQRCERGATWDLACTTIAAKVREHIDTALSRNVGDVG